MAAGARSSWAAASPTLPTWQPPSRASSRWEHIHLDDVCIKRRWEEWLRCTAGLRARAAGTGCRPAARLPPRLLPPALQALREKADAIRAARVRIFVRRGECRGSALAAAAGGEGRLRSCPPLLSTQTATRPAGSLLLSRWGRSTRCPLCLWPIRLPLFWPPTCAPWLCRQGRCPVRGSRCSASFPLFEKLRSWWPVHQVSPQPPALPPRRRPQLPGWPGHDARAGRGAGAGDRGARARGLHDGWVGGWMVRGRCVRTSGLVICGCRYCCCGGGSEAFWDVQRSSQVGAAPPLVPRCGEQLLPGCCAAHPKT